MNFVVFSDDWGRHPSSCEHLFRKLIDDHKIIWINTIGYRTPSFSAYDINRAFKKILSWFKSNNHQSEVKTHKNLMVLSPVIIPYNKWKIIRFFNKIMVDKAISKALNQMNLNDYILIGSLPNIVDFYKKHKNKLKIYYCVDDFTEFPGVDSNLINIMERDLIISSDIVLYSANFLEKKVRKAKSIEYFPHGVDFNHFYNENYKKSKNNESPVIGFFGYLSQWIDLDLIIEIAKAKPEWCIVLIGGSDQNIDHLKEYPNIIAHGSVDYKQLPKSAASFDVGIIPFKINELTMAVNPLKFLEYMAMGLPVVSTPLPELLNYKDYVYLADNYSEFIKQIELALEEDTFERKENRVELARANSWESKANKLIEIINSHNH